MVKWLGLLKKVNPSIRKLGLKLIPPFERLKNLREINQGEIINPQLSQPLPLGIVHPPV